VREGSLSEEARKRMARKSTPVRRSDSRDAEVGRRVRTQRLSKRLSQTALGQMIGVTFQQVQKYENGINRIGAGRLSRIAEVLDVPVSYFFPGETEARLTTLKPRDSPFDLLSTSGAIQLVRAYARIERGNVRSTLVQIAEYLAKAQVQQSRRSRKE
jgi:DNA-binding XRE family transcriptional regulator